MIWPFLNQQVGDSPQRQRARVTRSEFDLGAISEPERDTGGWRWQGRLSPARPPLTVTFEAEYGRDNASNVTVDDGGSAGSPPPPGHDDQA